MSRRVLVSILVLLVVVALPAAAPGAGGRLDGQGNRLLAEGRGDQACLTLVEPRIDLRLRRCLLGATAGEMRLRYVSRQCRFGTRLFGIAEEGTRQVNLSVDEGPATRVKVLRIPTRVQQGGGVAFVVRRSIAGARSVRLTAYDRDQRRLAQRTVFGFRKASCPAPAEA